MSLVEETGVTPRFGRAVRGEWLLDPDLAYLNHGTVGVTPRAVLDVQEEIRREIETNPSGKLLREICGLVGGGGHGRLRAAAERIARFLGCDGNDLVFVGNATDGVNAVLRSVDLSAGDGLLMTETTYGGVRQAVRYASGRSGAEVQIARLPCPVIGVEAVLAAVEEVMTERTRLAVLDHIVSETGVVLPIAELVSLCRQRGVQVLIDGAHAPGQLALDIPAIGADWYAANLHKWAFAPRSCGILWADPAARAELHPTVVSWGLEEGFTAEFDWTGTRDPSAWLAAPAGIEFLERLDPQAMREYNHDLVWQAAQHFCERWGGEPASSESHAAFMTSVPLPRSFAASDETARELRNRLLFEHRIEVPIFAWRDRLWTRLSAQVYNEAEEFERLFALLDGWAQQA